MAKIKFGMMMTDGRGKLGGHVLSKNRGGSYVRTKVTPVNPQTTSQSSIRSTFGAIAQAWSSLSESERESWNGAVSQWQTTDIFGDIINPTGKTLYQRLNTQLAASGQTQISLAPAKLEMVEGIVTAVQFEISGNSIDLVGNYSGLDARIVVSATSSMSQGTKFVKNKLRQIYYDVAGMYGEGALYLAYIAKFGVPTAGANIVFGIKYVLPNGQASPVQTVKATVTA